MASIVLVHGASHTPAHFATLITALEAAGREVACPALPTSGDKDADMLTDVAVITAALTALLDAGKQVVVVAHSYGGMPSTEAVTPLMAFKNRAEKGLAGGVVHLVYMTAMLPLKGMTMLDAIMDQSADGSGQHNQEPSAEMLSALARGAPEGYFRQSEPEFKYYNDVEPAEAVQKAVDGLNLQSLKSVRVPLSNEGWRYVGVTYIVTTNDMALPEAVQRKMVGWAGCEVDVVEMSAGHSPWMMHLETVRDVVLRVGGQ